MGRKTPSEKFYLKMAKFYFKRMVQRCDNARSHAGVNPGNERINLEAAVVCEGRALEYLELSREERNHENTN